MPQSMRFFDRCKFMWDGETYDTSEAAEAKKNEYQSQGFETRLLEEEGRTLLYTRRVVKEIVLEGEGG
jgi:hypothetical protein